MNSEQEILRAFIKDYGLSSQVVASLQYHLRHCGFKIVPVELTIDMLQAGQYADDNSGLFSYNKEHETLTIETDWREAYKAQVRAFPIA